MRSDHVDHNVEHNVDHHDYGSDEYHDPDIETLRSRRDATIPSFRSGGDGDTYTEISGSDVCAGRFDAVITRFHSFRG
ncbi:hypothetical protein KHP11_27895 [Rhodococcus erythropolis]|uniref:hypothetical protein n=1 Tax=Rhodococcus erythropolis TaxID=1833 RepID=UPI0011131BA3|nr:hypothetical protein [Rhodococcus erythropolis]MBT1258289.1 hypothetical protein [Rhodococcus erythropolis]